MRLPAVAWQLPAGSADRVVRPCSARARLSSHASHSLADSKSAPLTHSQELAALALFLTSESSHMLPESLDPKLPLDPDLVLDMALSTDPTERAADLQLMEAEAWETPVVIFGKRGDQATKQALELLHSEDYFGRDGAGLATVYVDRRGAFTVDAPHLPQNIWLTILLALPADSPVLIELLSRLTHRSSLPVILVGGVPLGGYKELSVQHSEGHLSGLMERQGCVLGRDAIKRRMKERQRELTGRQQQQKEQKKDQKKKGHGAH